MRTIVALASAGLACVLAAQASAATPFVTPNGATGIRLCYFAANPDPAAAKPTTCRDTHTAQGMSRVIGELNRLADGNHGQGTCVRDNHSETRVVIAYRDGHRERVDVHFGGCQFATHEAHPSKGTTQPVRQDVARRAGYIGQVP